MSTETETSKPSDERDLLRAKIEASERRIAEQNIVRDAKEAAEKALDYTRRKPLTVIGGAVIAGIAIGLMTRPGRRIARNAAVGAASMAGSSAAAAKSAASNVSKKRVSAFGNLIADAAVAYSIRLIDGMVERTQAGKDAFEDATDGARAKARELRRDAAYLTGSTLDRSRTLSRKASRKVSRTVRDLGTKSRH